MAQVWSATLPSYSHPERNEDNLWIALNRQAAAVIDGMGSYRRRTPEGEIGGEHASALVAEILAATLDPWPPELSVPEAKQRARAAVEAANAAIYERLNGGAQPESGERRDDEQPMVGVALTLALLCEGGTRVLMAQHGDTRGYVLKSGALYLVTEDQDRMAYDVMQGKLDANEAVHLSEMMEHFDGLDAGRISEAGLGYLLDKSIFGALGDQAEAPETAFSLFQVGAGDRIILLSDGVHSNLSLGEIEGFINYPDNPAQMLVDFAYQRSQLPRLPDPQQPGREYNLRASPDDATAIILTVE